MPDDLTIRCLRTTAEYRSCVDLQRRIWGADFVDVVPASLLHASQKVGGLTAGAFLRDNALLVGLVLGLTGIREGLRVHWSHMLGVLPEHRSRGIGRRLKEFQRSWLLERGVSLILWTFDPLISGNAHFNLNLLGVEIDAYEPEMYGETGSDLHSFGTDRFIARWDLSGPDACETPDHEVSAADGAAAEGVRSLPLANRVPGRGDVVPADPDDTELRRLGIEIPGDILRVHREDPARARTWRDSTRSAFMRCIDAGYQVAGFTRLPAEDRGIYVLERELG